MGETSFGIYLYHCHPIVTGEMRLIDVRKYKKNPFWPCLNVTFGIWIRSMIVHMLNQLILNFCVFNAKWYQFVMNFLDKIFSLPEERPTAPPNDKDNEENLPDQNILADCKFEKVKINIDDLE
ncbi:hypothetical protein TVAG_536620 [Trichomonas vaginalis G3]|uniref:Uncharacterized protein n=1 Tax=Trichomonas vaginalis (strain ATCC PRA-98 / G3) TaxID=412133 RepID=A2GL46_TRIV3|nr:hypothetical protein TVAGG3_0048900 [Trichomonas vaginalis G3]EAX82121.1 hypothetical protein TVAG_536620 [Trichomonas vaginalis G3]KAI5541258.1 hypothetical protein TVAGG3_0048900 [Trichomonas vaginalis G3]|eukprot:XP_001295051.1 hypothetical protein [Trichomonas vaginalis G3]